MGQSCQALLLRAGGYRCVAPAGSPGLGSAGFGGSKCQPKGAELSTLAMGWMQSRLKCWDFTGLGGVLDTTGMWTRGRVPVFLLFPFPNPPYPDLPLVCPQPCIPVGSPAPIWAPSRGRRG